MQNLMVWLAARLGGEERIKGNHAMHRADRDVQLLGDVVLHGFGDKADLALQLVQDHH